MTTDPLVQHTSAAQQRILTAAEKRTIPPEIALPLIRNSVQQILDSGACSIVDRKLALSLIDLADVVEQLAPVAHLEAWFGAWECGCTDTERSPLGIPEFCPLHGRKLICNSAGSTKVQLNHSGVSGYGFKAGAS